MKCRFLRREENQTTLVKPLSKEENQQTQPTYDARSGKRVAQGYSRDT